MTSIAHRQPSGRLRETMSVRLRHSGRSCSDSYANRNDHPPSTQPFCHPSIANASTHADHRRDQHGTPFPLDKRSTS